VALKAAGKPGEVSSTGLSAAVSQTWLESAMWGPHSSRPGVAVR
jgi:hypothetical protein